MAILLELSLFLAISKAFSKRGSAFLNFLDINSTHKGLFHYNEDLLLGKNEMNKLDNNLSAERITRNN